MAACTWTLLSMQLVSLTPHVECSVVPRTVLVSPGSILPFWGSGGLSEDAVVSKNLDFQNSRA